MFGKLLTTAIVIDILMILTGAISGARQLLASLSIVIFAWQIYSSLNTSTPITDRLFRVVVGTFLAVGFLVAPVGSCIRDAKFNGSGSSLNCEAGIGGIMICREEP